MTVVTTNDLRVAGFCVSGAKIWFEQYGFDFRDFLKNGIDVEVVRATGDACGLRAVEIAEARTHGR